MSIEGNRFEPAAAQNLLALFLEHDWNRIRELLDVLQKDMKAALRTAVEAGFMTRNEARDELDMPALPGLDEPVIALNMGTGGGTTNIGNDTSQNAGTPNDF